MAAHPARLLALVIVLLVGVAAGAVLPRLAGTPATAAEAKKDRFFEMRIYTSHDGKLDDLHKRFRDHTNRLFVKHGMELVGYWVPTSEKESKNTLVYILAYPDQAARDKSWKGFMGDPEWKKAFQESHVNGELVKKVESRFMTPADYSPIK